MNEFTPGRQQDAYFVIRGFVYQVDTTILRWLQLAPGDILELERGEDIDHVAKQLGTATANADFDSEPVDLRRERLLEQIKRLEGSVTLTSTRAVLANFAAHKRANAGWRLRFRYTTNAKAASEAPPVLPSFSQPAIEVWRDIATGRIEASKEQIGLNELRRALLNYSCPSDFDSVAGRDSWQQFQNDLRYASDADFRDFVIDVEWGLGEDQADDLRNRIQRELQASNLAACENDASDVYRRLFLHVFQTLSRTGLKRLKHDDLQACLASPPDRQERQLLREIVDFVTSWHEELKQRIDLLERNITTKIADSTVDVKAHLDLRLTEMHQVQMMEKRLDDARPLMDEGKWQSVLSHLTKLRGEARNLTFGLGSSRAEILGRICGYEGVCHWQLDQKDAAQRAFEEELRWLPESARAKSHVALALQESHPERAIQLAEDARRDAEIWPLATSVLLQATFALRGWRAVAPIIRVTTDVKGHSEIILGLGAIAIKGKRYRAARSLAKQAINVGLPIQTLPSAYRLLADASISPLHEATQALHFCVSDSMFFAHSASIWESGWSSVAEKLWREAEAALSRFIELTTGWQNPQRRQIAFAQRAQARFSLGLDDAALQDCDRVLTDPERNEDHSEYAHAFFLKGLVLAQQNRAQEAIEAFDVAKSRCHEDILRFQARLSGAQLLADMGKWNDVIDWISADWHPAADDRYQIEVASLLMLAYHQLEQSPMVAAVRKDLVVAYPDDPVTWCALAEQARRDGKSRVVIRHLEKALYIATHSHWPRSLGKRIANNLAVEHALRHHYRRAAILLRPLVDPSKPNEALYNYLLCLDRMGRHHEALDLARKARNNGPALVPHSNIEAAISEQVGDLELAARLRRELAAADPLQISHALRLAYIEQEIGNITAAQNAIESIDFQNISDDPQKLMRVARARADFGLPDALEWAYRARKLAIDDADIHFQYVGLLHYSSSLNVEGAFLTEEVQPECAVFLKRRSQTEVLVLTAHPIVEVPDIHEVKLEDWRAALLLKKRVGDKVLLRQVSYSGSQVPHEIVEIQSKYIYAANESIRFFEEGTLHHGRLQAFHHEPGNAQELIDQMQNLTRNGPEAARTLEEFYLN